MKKLYLFAIAISLSISFFANAAPTIINPDQTPNVIYECDIPTIYGSEQPMDQFDIFAVIFEVSNDNQETWTHGGNSIKTSTVPAKCLMTFNLSGSPDGTYFYRSKYAHTNGQESPYTPVLEVKLERPLTLLPMSNPRMTPQ